MEGLFEQRIMSSVAACGDGVTMFQKRHNREEDCFKCEMLHFERKPKLSNPKQSGDLESDKMSHESHSACSRGSVMHPVLREKFFANE